MVTDLAETIFFDLFNFVVFKNGIIKSLSSPWFHNDYEYVLVETTDENLVFLLTDINPLIAKILHERRSKK